MIKQDPAAIWQEYQRGRNYNAGIDLYDTVERNEQFYIGDQWVGLNAPDLDKPVLNFLKRVCSYFVSQIVSDDVGISVTPHSATDNNKAIAEILSDETHKVIEATKLTAKYRQCIRDAVVDGDTGLYYYYSPDKMQICAEVIDNTKVIFGNPYVPEKEEQPYIVIVQPMLLDTVRKMAKEAGIDPDSIQPDDETAREDNVNFSGNGADRVTVLIKMWRENGTIHYCKVTRSVVLKPATDLGYTLYPFAWMPWERIKNSYHGQAAVTGLIPNQIAVNKLWAMALRHQQMNAFPKVVYDKTRIPQWTNRVGEAVGVAGDPTTAIASAYRAPDMSAQLIDMVDKTVSMTRDFMGASDAALGNVKPDNTSAIIAVQQASAAPLELNKLNFYQFVEDGVRVIVDIMCRDYGVRQVSFEDETGVAVQTVIDFDAINLGQFDLNVDVGGASYWNEMAQISTIDNLFSKGVITDPVTYLEAIPDNYIKNKQQIIADYQKQRQQQEVMGNAVPAVQTTA